MDFLPFTRPCLDEETVADVAAVLAEEAAATAEGPTKPPVLSAEMGA